MCVCVSCSAQTPVLSDYKEHHTDVTVHFVINIAPDKMAEIQQAGIEAKFKLTTKFSTGRCFCFCLHVALTHTHTLLGPGSCHSWQRSPACATPQACLVHMCLSLRTRMYSSRVSTCVCVCVCHTGNMMLFDKDGKIKHYTSPEAIIADFYDLRLNYYEMRRQALLKVSLSIRPRTSSARLPTCANPTASVALEVLHV